MSFYTAVISKSDKFSSLERIASVELLEPETRRRVMAIVTSANAQGIQVMLFETYRSRERQAELFTKGVTQLRESGTHHYGLACDIVRLSRGQPTWHGDYSFLSRLAREHGLLWGGDWGRPQLPNSFVDVVHLQRCDLSRQEALFDGTWYPDEGYNPYDDAAQQQ